MSQGAPLSLCNFRNLKINVELRSLSVQNIGTWLGEVGREGGRNTALVRDFCNQGTQAHITECYCTGTINTIEENRRNT